MAARWIRLRPFKRKVGHALVFDDLADGCAFGFEHRTGCPHFHRFGYGADFKNEIHTGLLLRLHFQSVHSLRAKTFHLDADRVLADVD